MSTVSSTPSPFLVMYHGRPGDHLALPCLCPDPFLVLTQLWDISLGSKPDQILTRSLTERYRDCDNTPAKSFRNGRDVFTTANQSHSKTKSLGTATVRKRREPTCKEANETCTENNRGGPSDQD